MSTKTQTLEQRGINTVRIMDVEAVQKTNFGIPELRWVKGYECPDHFVTQLFPHHGVWRFQ